ncbi:MAG TPA: MFS transporter [Pseudonocardiaceae bacterium]|jgi:EmrB/QacA subfamily drug resistance transporter|nr:MFS transporter [Pseudonocardiaceae bacterium]
MTTEASTGAEAEATGASTARSWGLILAAIVGAEFLLQLDGTIITVSLPNMQSHLGLGITAASWVVTGFFVAFGGLLLLAGRLGDVLGHRRVFLAGIGLITVASLIAGLAPNFPVLVAGRVLQGAGAGLAGPSGLALLTILFDDDRRQRAFGVYSTVTGLGASAGMLLGGLLTWAGQWRWSLLVNVPICLVILAIGVRVLGVRAGERNQRSIGLTSGVLVTLTLAALIYGLSSASQHGWTDTATIVSLIAFVVLAAILFTVDSRTAEPLLPARVFTDRARLGGLLNLVLSAAALTSFLVYVNQYLHTVLGLSAVQNGLAILPFALALLATAQLLGKYIGKIDLKVRAVVGLVLMLGALVWLTQLGAGSSYVTGVLPQIILLGAGIGLAIVPFNMIVLSSAAPEDTGIVAGVAQLALTVGGSVGVAVLLIPFTEGGHGIAANISKVFVWGAAIVLVALIVSAVFWFGPGARKTAAA